MTRAADEPRPVLWASVRRTPKSVNRGDDVVVDEGGWDG